MSRYKAYPEYRDSGVEWLGEAPAQWATIPVGRLYVRTKRTGHADKELLSVYRDHGVVPTSSRDDNNNKPSEDLTAYQLVEPNNLVMNKMKAWQGSIAISEHEGIVSPAYFVYQPNAEMFDVAVPKYIHYLLRHPIYIAQYLRQSKGIRVNQWDLDPDEFKKIELLLPRKEEQKKIIAFLDHEIAKIDALIERQQRLIELLKEKRQAVISHAVTKGLDPNAPLKDSGVEWLGDVPAHWAVAPLKRFAEVIDCKHYTVQFLDEGLPIVSIRELRDDSIDISNAKLTSVEEWNFLREGRVPQVGDIVFCRNASVGAAGYVADDLEFCMGQDVCLIRTGKANRYMHFQIVSRHVREQIEAFLVGATIRRANVEEIRGLVVALPPEAEQIKIATYLESTLSEFNVLSEKANRTVGLLTERRTALISAAVTGKIDVRDWQPAAA